MGLCRETWGEEALFDALKDLPHGKKRLRTAAQAAARGLPEFDPYGKGRTRLMYAAQKGDAVRVEWLLKRGAKLELADWRAWCPLHFASYHGHANIVSALLSKGAPVDLPGSFGHTPLGLANDAGNVEAVRALLRGGASISSSHLSGDGDYPSTIGKLLLDALAVGSAARGQIIAALDM